MVKEGDGVGWAGVEKIDQGDGAEEVGWWHGERERGIKRSTFNGYNLGVWMRGKVCSEISAVHLAVQPKDEH